MWRKRLPSRLSTQGWTVTILRSVAWRDRAGDGAAFGQQLEVLGRGMNQGAAAGGGLVDRLLGADPHRVDRLRAVMQGDLVLGRLGQEEPGVEAPGREGGRDPVGEGHHEVGGDLEILGLDQVDDAGLVLGQLGAPLLLDALKVGGGDQRRAGRACAPAGCRIPRRPRARRRCGISARRRRSCRRRRSARAAGHRRRRPPACRRETPARRRRHRSCDGAPP